jgi:DnaJ-class molecular chaperone
VFNREIDLNWGEKATERRMENLANAVGVKCPRCGGSGVHKTANMSERVCALCSGARKVAVEKAKAERVRMQNEAKAS